MTRLAEDAPPTQAAPPAKVVPVRHPTRWLAAALLLVLLAQLVQGAARNRGFHWHVFASYFFSRRITDGVEATIKLTVVAMVVGVVLGTLLAIGRLSTNPVVSGVCWLYVWFFRGVPVFVQILFWYAVGSLLPRVSLGVPFGGPELVHGAAKDVFTSFAAAILGLGLSEAAYYSEIVRAGLLSVDEGQVEAASALGMTAGLALRRVVLPQAARVVIPPTGNEVISMLKTSSLVSVIAYTELLYSAQLVYAANYQVIPLLTVAIVWYLIMTTVLTVGQYYLERRFARGAARELPPTPLQRLRLLAVRSQTVRR